MPFVFSADGHVVEPNDLFETGLPPSLRPHGIRSERQGDHLCTLAGDKVVHRLRLRRQPSGEEAVEKLGHTPRGQRDPRRARLEDMASEGIDAEIVFPSVCLWTYGIEDVETELATAQIYNDWNDRYFGDHLDRFVRCGVLPVRDFANTASEMKRLAGKGYTAAMIPAVSPTGMPKYNDEAWDPVFELAGELDVVLVLHTGTGLDTVQPERRAGGAVINYANQACDAWQTIMYMVAGGLLDRHPTTQIAVIESGASWLAGALRTDGRGVSRGMRATCDRSCRSSIRARSSRARSPARSSTTAPASWPAPSPGPARSCGAPTIRTAKARSRILEGSCASSSKASRSATRSAPTSSAATRRASSACPGPGCARRGLTRPG